MLASLTELYIYIYTYAVCVSDNDSAIVEPTQPTELKCDHPQCSIFEKTKLSNKIRFSTRKEEWGGNLILRRADTKFTANYLLI